MLRIIEKGTGVLFGAALIVFLLLSSVDMNCFKESFFAEQYKELHTAQSLGLSQEDLMRSTTTLLDYLKGERDDIDVLIRLNGEEVMAFNERESAHMVDVRDLYQNAMTVRTAALAVWIACVCYALWRKRSRFLALLSEGLLSVSLLFVLLLALLGIWILADFTGFWTTFHHLFFDNDLWLLNPQRDLMINLFPESFFLHLVTKIVLWFLAFYLPCLIIALFNQKPRLQMKYFPGTLAKGKPAEIKGSDEEKTKRKN